jgi:hypothetical protein
MSNAIEPAGQDRLRDGEPENKTEKNKKEQKGTKKNRNNTNIFTRKPLGGC